MLNFAVRMGCGAFTVIWPYDESPATKLYFPCPADKKGTNIKKPYSTGDSLVVPYQSTDPAQQCLTSQFGWDAVLSLWYDRMTRPLQKSRTPVWKNASGQKNRKVNFFVLLHYFQHFGGLGIVGPLFHHTSSIKFTNVGEYYLNSIRKSWLPNRRWGASLTDLRADTWLRAQEWKNKK